ncbi:hypothetical protein HYZ97_05090 [Candidatus Pacearchaeota archaeon]|nr:hypothetical protein [Candidatus Pacearchaeota archaeon]
MKKGLFFVLIVLLLPAVSAELFLTQPSGLYNLGDELNMTISITRPAQTNDFATVALTCNGSELELYKSPVSVKAGEQKQLSFTSALDNFVLGGLRGDCVLQAAYADESVESRRFEISDEVIVTITLPASIVDPGSILQISGNAVKKNGQPLTGSVEMGIAQLGSSALTAVQNGAFVFNVSIPAQARSGLYPIKVSAYDTDFSSQTANHGSAETTVRIRQVLTRLDIALSSLSLFPGNNLSYTVLAYDQADDEMAADTHVQIFTPLGAVRTDKLAQTGATQTLSSNSNDTSGSWSISAQADSLQTAKSFLVEEHMNATFVLENDVLVIRNTGNVQYTKPVHISIGENGQIKDVSLDVGMEKRYRLDAPDGEYAIEVDDGNLTSELGSVFLSGNAVSVRDTDENFISTMPWFWVIIILVVGCIGFFYYLKTAKRDYWSEASAPAPTSPRIAVLKPHAGKETKINQGEKQKATFVALKLKHEPASGPAHETIKKVIAEAKAAQAHGSKTPGSMMFVLTSATTKRQENTLEGVQLAQTLSALLSEHNQKYSQKIEYGIGVHDGELIAELTKGSFAYHALGNAVIAAKKLAASVENGVSISDPVHSITRARVKVERGREGWNVKSINDNSKYSDFIDSFMHRNG